MATTRLGLLAAIVFFTSPAVRAVEPQELLRTYCQVCHGGEKPKGGFALPAAADFERDALIWKSVQERLHDGSMPPAGKPQPTAAESTVLTGWLAKGREGVQRKQHAAEGRARLRRLNRIEYNNTIRDLLQVDVNLADALPEDGIAHGFDNVDVALDLSATLFERYLAAADVALDAALIRGPKPKPFHERIEPGRLAKESQAKTNRALFGTWDLARDDAFVLRYDPPTVPRMVIPAVVPLAGRYRYRIVASAENDPQHKLSLRVYAGTLRSGTGATWLHGVFDVAEQPATIEFTERLEKGDTISLTASGVTRQWNPPVATLRAGIAIHSIEVEGPLVDSWPPPSVKHLLGEVDPDKGTLADAEAILRRFVPHAFRRAMTAEELAPYRDLVKDRLAAGYRFEHALRVALKAVLCSPSFLYLRSSPGPLNDFELASRLSYFLWSTMPDDTLLTIALKGELRKPEVLRGQVERMLAAPRARAFTENFTGQWLDLRKLRMTDPDSKLYPEFDPLLEYSLPFETRLYFEEILKNDRSLLEFVHSDWSMLNARLAEHYGIGGVVGQSFRKTALPAGSPRGGVLTQAAVLKVTANGTNSSPVVRGAWVLDRILGTPAPPPPKDVPAIEPDIRGATTVRQQLARHRSDPACAGCHARIDPPGFALESFDPIGGWRNRYRVIASKTYRPMQQYDGKSVSYASGPAVNSSGELADGRRFDGIDGFKRLLLQNPDRLATALAERLTVYATGHAVELADRNAIQQIVAASRAKNYGFRTLVHEIVQSDLFRKK